MCHFSPHPVVILIFGIRRNFCSNHVAILIFRGNFDLTIQKVHVPDIIKIHFHNNFQYITLFQSQQLITFSVLELHANAAPPFTFGQRFMNQVGYFMGRFAIDRFFVERVAEAFAVSNISGNVRVSSLI